MATKVNAGEGVKRGDSFSVDPNEVIVVNDFRGRHIPPTEAEIIELASKMVDQGQIHPVKVRKVEDNRLQLVLGFTRTAAARLIREGFTDQNGRVHKDENFLLRAEIVPGKLTDQQLFEMNVTENNARVNPSPIDDAFNQQRFRDEFNWTDTKIAEFYGYAKNSGPVKVGRLKKLLQLDAEEQMLVHTGALGVQGAIELLDLPADKRKEALEAAKKENGKINGQVISAQVRTHHLADGQTPQEAAENNGGGSSSEPDPTKVKPRSVKEIRKFCDSIMKDENTPESIQRFVKEWRAFVDGKKTDKQMVNSLKRLYNASPADEQAAQAA